jgi:hypothetical protein
MLSGSGTGIVSLVKSIREELKKNPHAIEDYANHESNFIRFLAWVIQEPEMANNYFKKRFENDQTERVEVAQILKKYNWLIPLSMPETDIPKIIKIARQKGNHRAEINRMFIEYYSHNNFENLAYLVETWKSNPLFIKRIKIFHDCIFTLQRKSKHFNPSNVVLPTLISQIDGILNVYVVQLGIKFKRKEKTKWDEEFRKRTGDQIGSLEISDSANDILLNVLFQSAYPGKPLKHPFSFNRHKILHGEFINYGRLDNTLRAFLILDFLNFASTEGNK